MTKIKPTKATTAAQQFLDEYVAALKKYEQDGNNLNTLAKLAGVSGATVSDHKNGKKVEDPTFRMVFQVAYALLGKPSGTMTVKPKEIAAGHVAWRGKLKCRLPPNRAKVKSGTDCPEIRCQPGVRQIIKRNRE